MITSSGGGFKKDRFAMTLGIKLKGKIDKDDTPVLYMDMTL